MPATPTRHYPFFDHDGPLAFAHRGGATYGPNVGIENSMAAFANAVELGYRYLETDVHATADGVLVAFHDDDLDRVTDRTGRIGDLPWSEVSKARIGGREPIPTLEDILGTWPDVRVNIDVKEENAIRPLVEAVVKTDAHDRICVSSFSGHRIRSVRRQARPAGGDRSRSRRRGRARASPSPVAGRPARLGCAMRPGADRLPRPAPGHARIRRTRRTHSASRSTSGPSTTRRTMNALLDIGVDGLITDRIDLLRDVLVARDQWVV